MDQVFHVDCFVCMTCGSKLRGKPFYALDKRAYCEPCYVVSTSPSLPLSLLPPSPPGIRGSALTDSSGLFGTEIFLRVC